MPSTHSAPARQTIGLLHPGAMGTSVGAALVAGGHRVLWCPEERSSATAERATKAHLEPVTLAALLEEADLVVSVCPPSEAEAVAQVVVGHRFKGTFIDANAISPRQARRIASTFGDGRFIDGGIIGPPAWTAGTTRLYLSGDGAADVATLFEGSPLDASAIAGDAGTASALKMCFASWTKGTAALLLALRAVADAEGVTAPLLDEWALSVPGLPGQSDRTAGAVAPKAWRFAGEMEEIADTFRGVGLPGGFFDAAAELYTGLAGFKDRLDPPVTLDEVVSQLLTPRTGA